MKDKMKNQKDFIREYRNTNFPYKGIITGNKELRKTLFKEFIQTKLKPCSHLYLLDHYTERQINDGIIEASNQIPTSVSDNTNVIIAASFVQQTQFETYVNELHRDFHNCIFKNTLEAKYYCFDLEGTNTVKTLKEIGKVIELFKKVLITHDIIDYDTEAKHTSKTVLALVEHLEYNDLKDGVFREIINDKENISIDLEGRFEGNNQRDLKDKYSRLKMYFDNYLKEGYRPVEEVATKKEEQIPKCNVPFIGDLLQNPNICDEILDAYYNQIPQPKSKNEVSASYAGKINRYYSPYKVSFYGAYLLRTDWELLEYNMKNVNHESGYFKHYKRDKVFEALKEYAKGFQYGFDNFFNAKVNTSFSLSNNEKSKTQRIIDFLSSPLNRGGFSESYGKDTSIFEGWYEDGINAGQDYCAWYFILSNHELFQPYFTQKTEFSETIKKKGNNLTVIIEKELKPLEQAFNSKTEYCKAVEAIESFYLNNSTISQPIFVKNGNIKNLAFALGEIWRSQSNNVISYEYLQFYKQTFTIFSNQSVDEKNIFSNNLYKYSISKT